MQIKKGDRFYCHRDVITELDSARVYIAGNIYLSDEDGCITDEFSCRVHFWDYPYYEKYFSKLEENQGWDFIKDGKTFIGRIDVGKELTGSIRQFDSGAVRDSNEGKSRPDLISPYFTDRLGYRLAFGAKKYQERNWEKGIPDAAFLESLERHLVAYKMGKTDEDHAAAIAFNIMGIIHNEEVRKLK